MRVANRRVRIAFWILGVVFVLPGCTSSPAVASTPSPIQILKATATPQPAWTPTAITVPATPAPFLYPTSSPPFSSPDEARKAARFPILVPGFVPDDLPFSTAWIEDSPDGSQRVHFGYSAPGDPLDPNLRLVFIDQIKTEQPVTAEWVTHQFKVVAWDVQEVSVRGQTGFTYWSPGNAVGNSAHLTWRENGIDYEIDLYGDWPEPDQDHPHRLDGLLLQIATSLQAAP